MAWWLAYEELYGDMDKDLRNFRDERRSEYTRPNMDNNRRQKRDESYENEMEKKSKFIFWR